MLFMSGVKKMNLKQIIVKMNLTMILNGTMTMTLMIMKIQKKMIQKMIQKKMVLLVQKVKKMIQKKMIQRKMVLLVQKVKNPKKQTILKGLQIILRVEKVTHMVIENFLLMKKKMTLPH